MAYRTILAFARSKKELKRIIETAILVAQKTDRSHIIGIYAVPSPVVYSDPNGFVDATLFEVHEQHHKNIARKLKTFFVETMRQQNISHEFRVVYSNTSAASDGVLESAFCTDLIITGQPDPDDLDSANDTPNTLIFDCGRPVLLVPYAFKAPSNIMKIAIAFNGKREAARAAFDALSLIEKAESVEIISVDPLEANEKEKTIGSIGLAEAFRRHGAQIKLTPLLSHGLSIEETIRQYILINGIDLLVMGAYSHSRLREQVFGGVTRATLDDMACLTLMSR